jgi:hypothetical protein
LRPVTGIEPATTDDHTSGHSRVFDGLSAVGVSPALHSSFSCPATPP